MKPSDPESPRGQELSPPVRGGVEERLDGLESHLQNIDARLSNLEARSSMPRRAQPLAALARVELAMEPEPHSLELSEEVEHISPVVSGQPSTIGFLGLAGLAFVVFGGAYFLRALTDSGVLPRLVGVGFGLIYAYLWLVVADRAKNITTSTVLTLASAGIIYPLLWEATMKLKAIPPGGAAFTLALSAPMLVGVGWRRSLHGVVWIITILSLVMGAILMFETGAFEAFSAMFIVFGGGTLWLTYGRRWPALRWPPALVADWVAVVMTVLILWPDEAPKDSPSLSIMRVLLLDMGLVLMYAGSFCIRILRRHRPPNTFEILQTLAVLSVGFGGAAWAAQKTGIGVGFIGAAAVVSAMACYGLSFAFSEKLPEERANVLFFTSLGMIFILVGGPMLLPQAALGLTFSGLGILAAVLGIRVGRGILVSHSALLLLAASLVSGTLDSLLGTAPPTFPPMGFQSVLILACLIGVYLFLRLSRDPEGLTWYLRLPSSIIGTLAVLGLGTFLLAAVAPLLGGAIQDPGSLTALRTGLLAFLAVLLASAGRWIPRSGLRWLVHPMLAVTGFQLLFQALPNGRPFTLFLAFTVFGAALALAQSLLKPPMKAA